MRLSACVSVRHRSNVTKLITVCVCVCTGIPCIIETKCPHKVLVRKQAYKSHRMECFENLKRPVVMCEA